jgi:predicted RNase H-like nuclease (RuvC/YqgF family)
VQQLKHQIAGYTAAVKESKDQSAKYQKELSELKKQQTESEWVPKKEFNKLNQEYTELEEDLEEKQKEIDHKSEQLRQLLQRRCTWSRSSRKDLMSSDPLRSLRKRPRRLRGPLSGSRRICPRPFLRMSQSRCRNSLRPVSP